MIYNSNATPLALSACLLAALPVYASFTPPASLASLYSLTTSTSLAFPTATLASTDADSLITSEWSLSKGRIEDGGTDLAFVSDPFPDSPAPDSTNSSADSGPVLQVAYPAGSFNNNTGGAQFYSLWNTTDGSAFQSVLLSYELAFDSNFQWVKGGKLPGLRGGPVVNGCDGGNQPNGSDCFSARVMWRTNAAGEVYAYIPTANGICNQPNILCNDDFGISIQRGSFGFESGQWSRISLLVQLNNPPTSSNGFIALYFNDVEALTQTDLQIRESTDINIGGLFFSTFFGGNDASWATPVDTHTYFRNIQLWGSSSPSNLTGSDVSAAKNHPRPIEWGWVICIAAVAFICGVGII